MKRLPLAFVVGALSHTRICGGGGGGVHVASQKGSVPPSYAPTPRQQLTEQPGPLPGPPPLASDSQQEVVPGSARSAQ